MGCKSLKFPTERLFAGGHRGVVTPVPIPNTEVKCSIAEGSAGLARARVGRRRLFLFKPIIQGMQQEREKASERDYQANGTSETHGTTGTSETDGTTETDETIEITGTVETTDATGMAETTETDGTDGTFGTHGTIETTETVETTDATRIAEITRTGETNAT